MGEASAKAQGLNGPITSAQRLRHSDQRVYVMKDAEANDGNGAVVGFIRMGHRRLFIYDHHGVNHEMEPLCTLDFYVHESRQRTGCGRRLFESMLQEERIKPHQQAVDRPSHKFLSFLNKHYKLKAFVPQGNKFVVFDEFFRDKPANAIVDRRRSGQSKPPMHPYRRHNDNDSRADGGELSQVSVISSRPPSGSHIPLSQLERQKAAGLEESGYLGLPSLKTNAFGSEPPMAKLSSLTLLSWEDKNRRPRASSAPGKKEALSNVPLPRQNSRDGLRDRHLPSVDGGRNSMSPLAMGAQGSMYSRHINASPTPPQQLISPEKPQQQLKSTSPDKTQQQFKSRSTTSPEKTSENTVTLEVNKRVIGGLDPPLRHRDGPSMDYKQLFRPDAYNSNTYQDRRGHLRLADPADLPPKANSQTYQKSYSSPSVVMETKTTLPPFDPYTTENKPRTLGSGWNLFGVVPSPKSDSQSNSRYPQSRLW